MKNRINYEKINEIRRTRGFVERFRSKIKIGDLMDVRTLEGRVYESKFEFWNERRKDISDAFTCSAKLLYPPIVNDVVNFLTQVVFYPLSILEIPLLFPQLQYSEDKRGYVLKEQGDSD